MRRRVLVVAAVLALGGMGWLVSQPGSVSMAAELPSVLTWLGKEALKQMGVLRDPWETKIPSAVRKLAQGEAKKYPAQNDQDFYVSAFSDGFLTALISPDGSVSRYGDEKSVEVIAFNAGRAAGLSKSAAAQRITLRDYGYREVTVTGTVSREFEASHFIPEAGNDIWWIHVPSHLSAALERPEKLALSTRRPRGPVVAKLKGFLSPPREMGGYGHMGSCAREFVVTEVLSARHPSP